MQTSLRIDDAIYRQAKAEAARLGTTLTRYIEEALRQRIEAGGMGNGLKQEVEERNRLMEQLLQSTAHFRIGSRPTRDELNER